VPAEVLVPVRPVGVDRCPDVGLPPLHNVGPWTGAPSTTLQAWAHEQLVHPLGTIIRDVVDGAPIVARIECHFAYGAHPEAPGHWHKGTSVYRPMQNGVALMTPPADWPRSA